MPTVTHNIPTFDSAIKKMVGYFEQTYKKDPNARAIPPLLVAHGNDGYTAIVRAEIADRDLTVVISHLLAMGSGCQTLIAGMDTLVKHGNEVEALDAYETGSFQREYEEKGETTGIKNCMLVVYMRRGGYRHYHSVNYTVDRQDGTLDWDEPLQGRLHPSGRVAEGLIAAFQRKPFDAKIDLRIASLLTIARTLPAQVAFNHTDPSLNREYRALARKMGLGQMDLDDDDDDL